MSDTIDWESRSAHVRRLPVYQPPLPCDVEWNEECRDGLEFSHICRSPWGAVWRSLIVGSVFLALAAFVAHIVGSVP